MGLKINKIILTVFAIFVVFWVNAIDAEAKEKQEYEMPDDAILIEYEDLGDGIEVYVYSKCVDVDSARSVSAKSFTKYYRFIMDGEDAVVISCTGNFSYGHSDGIARATGVSYAVIKNDPAWECSVGGFSTSKQNGNPASATVSFYIIYNYNGTRYDRSVTAYCNNNGNCY